MPRQRPSEMSPRTLAHTRKLDRIRKDEAKKRETPEQTKDRQKRNRLSQARRRQRAKQIPPPTATESDDSNETNESDTNDDFNADLEISRGSELEDAQLEEPKVDDIETVIEKEEEAEKPKFSTTLLHLKAAPKVGLSKLAKLKPLHTSLKRLK